MGALIKRLRREGKWHSCLSCTSLLPLHHDVAQMRLGGDPGAAQLPAVGQHPEGEPKAQQKAMQPPQRPKAKAPVLPPGTTNPPACLCTFCLRSSTTGNSYCGVWWS